MRRELVKVTIVPAEDERQIGAAAVSPPEPADALRRRDEALRRMRDARSRLAEAVAGIAGIEALRDDQWSIVHILKHLGADGGGHFSPVYDMIDQGQRELEPYETRDERYANAVEAALREVDEAIAFAEGLSAEQLLMHAARDGREHYVIGFVEAAAAHLDEHLEQLHAITAGLADARERRRAAAR